MTDTGKRLKAWRETRDPKLTQIQLADALGIKQATVCAFELGEHMLNEERALKIEEITSGEILAEDCVRDDRRWIVLEMKAARAQQGAV